PPPRPLNSPPLPSYLVLYRNTTVSPVTVLLTLHSLPARVPPRNLLRSSVDTAVTRATLSLNAERKSKTRLMVPLPTKTFDRRNVHRSKPLLLMQLKCQLSQLPPPLSPSLLPSPPSSIRTSRLTTIRFMFLLLLMLLSFFLGRTNMKPSSTQVAPGILAPVANSSSTTPIRRSTSRSL
ncbi:hypothetical protein DXG01_016128, partial [Tephrocybe rancida]